MKNYIIFNHYGTFIVAAMGPVSDTHGTYGVVAECRSIEQAQVVKAALEAKESK